MFGELSFRGEEVRGFLGDVNGLFFRVLPDEVDSRRENLTYILHLYVEFEKVELIEAAQKQRLGGEMGHS